MRYAIEKSKIVTMSYSLKIFLREKIVPWCIQYSVSTSLDEATTGLSKLSTEF